MLSVPGGDAVQRLGTIQSQLLELHREPALVHINAVAAAVLKLGKRPTQWILGGMMKGVDVLASNVPGPNFPLYVAGVKVDRFHAFGPPAGAALNITLFSYAGAMHVGFTGCRDTVPHLQRLAVHTGDAVAALDAALAG